MLRRLAISTVFNVAAIFAAASLLDGIDYGSDFWILILAGFVFALVNTFIKPVITFLSIPFIIFTLGIALFAINILMLYVTTWIVPHFSISSFGTAALAAAIIWLVNVVLAAVFHTEKKKENHK